MFRKYIFPVLMVGIVFLMAIIVMANDAAK